MIDFSTYAFSFSHAIVKLNERQFTGIKSISVNQELTESAIYGTDVKPLKRTVGQLSLGKGQLVFSDYGEGTDFFKSLGAEPFKANFSLDYTLQKDEGSFRTIECKSCRLTSFGIEHESSADGLDITFPFSFMSMRVDGLDLLLSPKALLQAGINIAQNLTNLL